MPAIPLKIAILVSGSGRTLQNLIDLQRSGKLDVDIRLVIASRPNLGGTDKAIAAGLPHAVVNTKDFPSIEAFSDRIFQLCDDSDAELVVLAGWLSLLRVPERYRGRVINIHPSLLPRFGGKGMYGHRVHESVLAAGCAESGCTVHLVDDSYDGGPIILQLKCPVLPGDTADTLAARVFEEEKKALPEAIRTFARNYRGSDVTSRSGDR
jgi:formyltetrahydrofolate-dependent phosphoribosylglycinamide formyltransferase